MTPIICEQVASINFTEFVVTYNFGMGSQMETNEISFKVFQFGIETDDQLTFQILLLSIVKYNFCITVKYRYLNAFLINGFPTYHILHAYVHTI